MEGGYLGKGRRRRECSGDRPRKESLASSFPSVGADKSPFVEGSPKQKKSTAGRAGGDRPGGRRPDCLFFFG